MKNFFKRNKQEESDQELTWSDQATQALKQSVAQMPVPGPMKKMAERELRKAAETEAQKQGHSEVTPEDLMTGLLAKMPENMRTKVEKAMAGGPEELEKLKKELQK